MKDSSYYDCNTVNKRIVVTDTEEIENVYSELSKTDKTQKEANAYYSQRNGAVRNLFVFNGEKNLGELGIPKDYLIDNISLRSRGMQAYLENEVVQIIVNRMVAWVIGNGLKLESEPNQLVLNSEGIEIDVQDFSDRVEARYSLMKEMRESVYSRMKNLSMLETTAFVNAFNGGDVLVVLRLRNGIVNYELVDGVHLRAPYGGTDLNPLNLDNGNHIVNGVEMDDTGQHIAYWVQKADYSFERIKCKSDLTGLMMAFLYGGMEYMIDNTRCIPVLSGLLQTVTQMDEYKTATLGSAKEQNSVAYQATYDVKSTGENVFIRNLATAQDASANDGFVPVDSQLKEMANTVSVSTGKQAFAMPPGSELKPLNKNEAELYFDPFWRTLFEVVCAAAGIPPNVALQRFDTSFSSARAAIKDWEHSLLLKRYKHGLTFLQPGYEFQLHVDILTGKIQAPGYLKAYRKENILVLAAYRAARWVGDNVPHIDPVKEVEAERAKLGLLGGNVPLTTIKKATEVLNGGSSKSNIQDFSAELEFAKAEGLDIEPVQTQPAPLQKPEK